MLKIMLPLHYYPCYVWSYLTKPFISTKTKELNQKLFWSIRNKKYDEMKEAIFQGANINTVFHPVVFFRESALTMVAVWGDMTLVKWLVDRGANIDFNDGNALKNCIQLGYGDLANYFIEEGADITTNKGRIIDWLADGKHFDTLKLILDNPKYRKYAMDKIQKSTDKSIIQWAEHYSNAGELYEKLNTKLESSVQKVKPVKI